MMWRLHLHNEGEPLGRMQSRNTAIVPSDSAQLRERDSNAKDQGWARGWHKAGNLSSSNWTPRPHTNHRPEGQRVWDIRKVQNALSQNGLSQWYIYMRRPLFRGCHQAAREQCSQL